MCRVFLVLIIISLTANLRAQSVRLATAEWPPYVSSESANLGQLSQIVTEAFTQAGYEVIIEFLPWDEAKQLEKYDNDAFFPSYGENTSVVCSHPISTGQVGLYKHKNSIIHHTAKHPRVDQTQALYNLRRYSFGVVKGYRNTDVFDSADFLIKKPTESDLANLRRLARKEVDFVVSDIFVAEYYIDKYYPEFSHLEFFGPSLQTQKLYVCFSKNSPNYTVKLTAFNKALASIQST